MEPDIDVLRALAQRKLMQQINHKNGSLRLMLGHVELLDHFSAYQAQALATRQKSSPRSTTSSNLASPQLAGTRDVASIVQNSNNTKSSRVANEKDDKDAVMIDCVEVEEQLSDEDISSDEDEAEVARLCDALELAPLQQQFNKHSAPAFVGEDMARRESALSYACFKECVCEVFDDDDDDDDYYYEDDD